MRFTLLPFLLAMAIAVANMPTAVYQICAWNHGTEQTEPWRSKLSVTSTIQRLVAFKDRVKGWLGELVDAPVFAEQLGIVALGQNAGRIKTLLNQRAEALAEMSTAKDGIAAAKNDDEKKAAKEKFVAAQAKFDAIVEDLAIEQQFADRERATSTVRDPDVDTGRRAEHTVGVRDRADDDPMAGYRNAADFARDVRAAAIPGGRPSDRLNRLRPGRSAAASGYDAEGGTTEGYEVPAQIRTELFSLVLADDGLLGSAGFNPEPTESNAVDIDGDETTPWGSTGVQAKWRAEAAAMTGTHVTTNLRTVRLHELYAFVLATDELLSDAPRLQNRITVKSAQAIYWKAIEALIFGTGAGQPLGLMNSPALITVAKDSGQAAKTLSITNLSNMYASIIGGVGSTLMGGGSLFWLANRDVMPQLIPQTIGNYPVYVPPTSGIKEAPDGAIFGLPVRWSEHCQTLGTSGDIILVSPVGYYCAIKSGNGIGPQFASSIHLYFDQGIQAFRWTFRLGGQPYLSAAVSPAKGSTKKSHFVALAAR